MTGRNSEKSASVAFLMERLCSEVLFRMCGLRCERGVLLAHHVVHLKERDRCKVSKELSVVSKVLSIVAFYAKRTRPLTFQNLFLSPDAPRAQACSRATGRSGGLAAARQTRRAQAAAARAWPSAGGCSTGSETVVKARPLTAGEQQLAHKRAPARCQTSWGRMPSQSSTSLDRRRPGPAATSNFFRRRRDVTSRIYARRSTAVGVLRE